MKIRPFLQPPKCLAFYFTGSSLYQRNPKFSFFLIATYCRGESTRRMMRTFSRGSLLSPAGQSESALAFFPLSPIFFWFFPQSPYPYKGVMQTGSAGAVLCTPPSLNILCTKAFLHAKQNITGDEIWFPNKQIKFCVLLKLLKEQFKNSVSFL